MAGDNQFLNERDESSSKDQFKNVVATRELTPFTLTMPLDNHSITPLLLSHSHLGDEGITNILSDVLIESQGQKTTIGDTTYDELTLLAVAGLIPEQQSPCPTVVASFTSTHTFDVEQIILNAQRQAALMIGKDIKEMIIKTSNECLPLLRGKIDELLDAITKIGVDPSPLKSQIENYMESVDRLDAVQHTHSMMISSEVQSERLAIVASQIVDALNSKGVQANYHQSLKVDLTTLDTKQEALKKEL